MYLAKIVNDLFQLYFILIILKIFLTWIPSIDWQQQPIKFVRIITDAYLDIFRRVIPPVGGLDFSPLVAIFVLQILQVVVVNSIATLAGHFG